MPGCYRPARRLKIRCPPTWILEGLVRKEKSRSTVLPMATAAVQVQAGQVGTQSFHWRQCFKSEARSRLMYYR